jgi:hypothetical protein
MTDQLNVSTETEKKTSTEHRPVEKMLTRNYDQAWKIIVGENL